MLGGLLVCIRELDHGAIGVGSAQKGDPYRKLVGCEASGHRDRGDVDQVGVEVRRAPLVVVRRVDALADERRLVFDRLVDDGVEVVVR